LATLGIEGVSCKETNVAGVAANCRLPDMLWNVAEIVTVPVDTELTMPGVALPVATTAAFEEDQLACVVTSWCVPSLYTAVAVSCALVPKAAWAFCAETSTDCNVVVVVVVPLLEPLSPQPVAMLIRAARRTNFKVGTVLRALSSERTCCTG
jgi:hypothetical protein